MLAGKGFGRVLFMFLCICLVIAKSGSFLSGASQQEKQCRTHGLISFVLKEVVTDAKIKG